MTCVESPHCPLRLAHCVAAATGHGRGRGVSRVEPDALRAHTAGDRRQHRRAGQHVDRHGADLARELPDQRGPEPRALRGEAGFQSRATANEPGSL